MKLDSSRISLFLLSAATLAFEINLTRLFSVAQFYHFAFMVVSIALLGFGASGSFQAALASYGRRSSRSGSGRLKTSESASEEKVSTGLFSLACGVAMTAVYLLTNLLPFDSFSIAWNPRQALVLILHYSALALPFFFSGWVVSRLLSADPEHAGRTYAANLFGSALGCGLALALPPFVGGEGMVTLSSAVAGLAALVPFLRRKGKLQVVVMTAALALIFFSLADFGSRAAGRPVFSFLNLKLSPYKGLSYALQYPDAQLTYQRWNAYSRIDVVQSASIHSLLGLSYRYLRPTPPEEGLLVDGDDLTPVIQPEANLEFAAYLTNAAAFLLRPEADTLVLGPRGGLDILTALSLGARSVTAVEVNPLISQASPVYADPRVETVNEADRAYIRRSQKSFDIIVLSLTSSYHPVRSGAYSLAEDYRYTVEAFTDAIARLKPGGLLVVSRWMQTPPSECLRTFGLAVTALERTGADPTRQVVALRSYNTATILVNSIPFTDEELNKLRQFAGEQAFDLMYAPGLRPEESNLYNIFPEPIYYETFTALLNTNPREDFYNAYAYDVRPPTDDHPFFGHYFKWSQAGQVIAELGKTWQPFGGAGYFVVLALLALAAILSAVMILLPAAFNRQTGGSAGDTRQRTAALAYFSAIGFAFLFVEIPLIQRFILYLGHPAYAMTSVLFSLLLFSGIGSSFSGRIPSRLALAALVGLSLGMPVFLPNLIAWTLGWPWLARLLITGLVLAPLGFLMGIPFPAGIRTFILLRVQHKLGGEISGSNLASHDPAESTPQPMDATLIPWAWAANGAASVISAVLAALLALSFGFNWVLVAGAACYAGALLIRLLTGEGQGLDSSRLRQ